MVFIGLLGDENNSAGVSVTQSIESNDDDELIDKFVTTCIANKCNNIYVVHSVIFHAICNDVNDYKVGDNSVIRKFNKNVDLRKTLTINVDTSKLHAGIGRLTKIYVELSPTEPLDDSVIRIIAACSICVGYKDIYNAYMHKIFEKDFIDLLITEREKV